MNRRSFFGASAAAAVAGPSAIAEAVAVPRQSTIALAFDSAPLSETLSGYASVLGQAARISAPIQFSQDRHYVYRTGHPAIDALRSVSGVYKQRMERRLPG